MKSTSHRMLTVFALALVGALAATSPAAAAALGESASGLLGGVSGSNGLIGSLLGNVFGGGL